MTSFPVRLGRVLFWFTIAAAVILTRDLDFVTTRGPLLPLILGLLLILSFQLGYR